MIDFWDYNTLGQMHIELTNSCNAACPMCVRFHNNSPLTRPDLKIEQITYDLFIKWFPPAVVQRCHLILFCGVHGDPVMAKDMYEICEYISNISDTTKILVNTNGGARSEEWWEKLGILFSKNLHRDWQLTFSIDGLKDTNHLYRRNVQWDKLEKNVRAFTKNGAKSDWDFLMFAHNEHQLDEARQTSKEWGVTNFIPKKALGVDNGKSLSAMPALDREGNLEYWISAPTNPALRNLEEPEGVEVKYYHGFNIDTYKEEKVKHEDTYYQSLISNAYEKLEEEDDPSWNSANSTIICKSSVWNTNKKEIFVDNHGRVLPCCYVGTHLNGKYSDFKSLQLHNAMQKYGWDNFSLTKHSLAEILEGNHLNRVFADSWEIAEVKCGRMAYCAATCGKVSAVDKIFTHSDVENKSKFRHIKDRNSQRETTTLTRFLAKDTNHGNDHSE